MRARAPARQRRAVGRDEAYAQHALGHRHHAVDAQRAPRAARVRFADAHGKRAAARAVAAPLRILRRLPFDPQMLRTTKRRVRHIREALFGEPHVRQAARQLVDEDLHLHAREMLAHALMRTVAERQVIGGIVAVDVEQVRIGEAALVTIRRRRDDQQLRAGGNRNAADRRVARRDPPPRDDRSAVTQALVDRVRDQRRVVTQLSPRARMLEQQLQRVRRCVRGGLVRGNDARHHHRMQIRIGDDVRMLALHADAELHPAGPRRILPHLPEHLARVLPELSDRMRDRNLLVRPRPSPGVDGMRDRVRAQRIHVRFGHAQKMQRDRERHFPQHLVDEVRAAIVDEAVDVFARKPSHHRLMRAQRVGRERLDQQTPPRHVRGLVLVDERAAHRIAVRRERRVRVRPRRRDLLERDRRAEGPVVAKDRLDVVIARDDPVTELRAVEHRLALARPTHVLGRVLLIGVVERIECRRPGARRATGRMRGGIV
ncbi:Uncharacterised protein [Burkholderia pseudomallei]|nr:Uncharacterised protein [Burkholderia pseudomallei]